MTTPKNTDRRQACLDVLGEELPLLFLDGHDDAILGVAERDGAALVIYDVRKILAVLRKRDGMSREEAEEFFDYNIAGSWHGETTPIYLIRAGR